MQARDHGARHAADAAEYGGGEERQQQVEAHLRADLHEKPGHDAGHGGERRAEQPDDADRPAHVDAGDAGELLVLAHRAHGAADCGAGEEKVDRKHEQGATPSDRSWSGVARTPRPIFMAICSAAVK